MHPRDTEVVGPVEQAPDREQDHLSQGRLAVQGIPRQDPDAGGWREDQSWEGPSSHGSDAFGVMAIAPTAQSRSPSHPLKQGGEIRVLPLAAMAPGTTKLQRAGRLTPVLARLVVLLIRSGFKTAVFEHYLKGWAPVQRTAPRWHGSP